MAWIIMANLSGGDQPASQLDTQYKNVASFGIVPSTASGTNTITLTPTLSGYVVPAYADLVAYSFKAANSNSGATTLKVGSLASLNCYRSDGTTQITTGDIISGQFYTATYNSALNSSAGGFYIANIGQSNLPDPVTVAHGGTGDTTLTAYGVLIGGTTSTGAVQSVAVGTAGQVLTSNGAGVAPTMQASGGGFTLGTPVASTSGTSIDFTGIPSSAKMILINFAGVSTNGSSLVQIQLGTAGGFETTGYVSTASNFAGAVASTAGFADIDGSSTNVRSGSYIITLENSAAFTWACNATIGYTVNVEVAVIGGYKTLSAALTKVRITTVNGTDAFDAGEINIAYL